MAIDIQIPEFPESISEGTIGSWIKNVGDEVAEGETIVEVETDKVVLEIPAPISGVISNIVKNENEMVNSLEVVGQITAQSGASEQVTEKSVQQEDQAESKLSSDDHANNENSNITEKKTSPAVRKLMQEEQIDLKDVNATGKNNRVTKEDVRRAKSDTSIKTDSPSSKPLVPTTYSNDVERVPMSSLRKRISDRLVGAQQEYAMLTTFNEVNMQQIMDVRTTNKDAFIEKYGVKLGFMSFFVLAAIEALKTYPIMNASVDGDDIIYHPYTDVGVAVSTERGLVVPVIRNADMKSLSTIELEINQLAEKARDNKLSIDDLVGGTFTITNGGVFGSMLSTPIINPPQSAILGMHAIEKRPVVVNDEIIIAPMMYLALTYDHRIIDGKDAVLFLSHIKQIIENPIKLLLHI